jgi:DNA-binding GntR family transcriptional regulator
MNSLPPISPLRGLLEVSKLMRADAGLQEILDAIARRDAAGAADAMRHHIESSRKHITRAI